MVWQRGQQAGRHAHIVSQHCRNRRRNGRPSLRCSCLAGICLGAGSREQGQAHEAQAEAGQAPAVSSQSVAPVAVVGQQAQQDPHHQGLQRGRGGCGCDIGGG